MSCPAVAATASVEALTSNTAVVTTEHPAPRGRGATAAAADAPAGNADGAKDGDGDAVIRLVMISDTHGGHRRVAVPDGDILIHAGDFTRFGKLADAEDFNDWLGEQPHRHKVVVAGNHEANADWWPRTAALLSNATFLSNERTVLSNPGKPDVTVYGTAFSWPVSPPDARHWAHIPGGLDVLVTHGPAYGFVDGGNGCKSLAASVLQTRPRFVVSGHIHAAHGVARSVAAGTVFVNAANAKKGHGDMGWPAMTMALGERMPAAAAAAVVAAGDALPDSVVPPLPPPLDAHVTG